MQSAGGHVGGKSVFRLFDQAADQWSKRAIEIEFAGEVTQDLILKRRQRAVPADAAQVIFRVVDLAAELLFHFGGAVAANELIEILQGADQHHGDQISAGNGLIAEVKNMIGPGRQLPSQETPSHGSMRGKGDGAGRVTSVLISES